MLCTIVDIRGDYAFVRYEDTGVVSEVAIALLPFGVDVGDRLVFEYYEFTQVLYCGLPMLADLLIIKIFFFVAAAP